MGVPKFYRWVSERYPCLSETVKEFQIPEFDNLYLDMNGIVHVCSHPEDDNPHFRITEEKIFSDIMYYLEFLFRMIKPRKVFFMAVDGVAPRAKMNQQRGRRFRSAREAEELERKAREKGETLPTEKRFDSNCITPGTPFMVRLQEQLKYFVVKKVSTDPLWHGVRVYLSGHETPGEGEHKVMDFIRAEKSQPNYDPNTRHCLYGLDADLMMLGLATHEPHFSLLREEVRFGGKKDRNKRPATPEETTFHLLHLSLFREYLDFEFSALKSALPFEYNLENIIDDWVLMGFLVGNDFIPHLPNLHINHDALPLLWQTYIDTLPSCGGYINNGGHLVLDRFEKYLTALSKFDFDTFSEQAGDLKWLEGKKGQSQQQKAELLSAARKFRKNVKRSENKFAELMENGGEFPDFTETGMELTDSSPEDPSEDQVSSDDDSEDTLDDEFRHHKRNYYMTKMEFENVTPEVLRNQAEGYVRGIQWILLYYYEGVPSWSWFYPHHYAPYMSDVKDFKDMNLTFDLSTPFMPFEQLMAVLPAASKELLPVPYQMLMTVDSSPVIDFYPLDFSTDLNGKQQDWEAVVLIPFIDENRLLTAMRSMESQLTGAERSRNRHGACLLYEYTLDAGPPYISPIEGAFPDIAINHSRLTEIPIDGFWLRSEQMNKGLLEGVRLDVYFPGFPTLKHISHTSSLSKEGVKVFQMNSRGYNVMLHIQQQDSPELEMVGKEYLGKEIFVGWPHLYEAKVVEVSNQDTTLWLVEPPAPKGGKPSETPKKSIISRSAMDSNASQIWHRDVMHIEERYKDRLGIKIGDTDILLKALPMTGRKFMFGSQGRITMEKQFGTRPVAFALQATVKDIAVHDPSFCQFQTLQEYLPVEAPVFMLGWPHYGSQGEVIEVDQTSGRVRINITTYEEPQLSNIINNQQFHEEHYLTGYVAAHKLGLNSHMLSRLTGTIFVTAGNAELAREQQNPHRINVGLNLKFTKRGEEVPGYTKLVDGQWSYSYKTVDALRGYLAKFPEMFEVISKSDKKHNDMFYESEVIPERCEYKLKNVQEFLKSLPCSSVKSIKAGADIISEGVITALVSEVTRVVEINKKRQKRVKMQVKPHLLYRPLPTSGALIPDSATTYQLFDRVVNVRQGYSVPFGLRGTVVGIHPADLEVNSVYEIVFDEDFLGGISIRNSSGRGYRMPPSALLNLTHGERKNGVKMPQMPAPRTAGHHDRGHNQGYNNQARGGQSRGYSDRGFDPNNPGNRGMTVGGPQRDWEGNQAWNKQGPGYQQGYPGDRQRSQGAGPSQTAGPSQGQQRQGHGSQQGYPGDRQRSQGAGPSQTAGPSQGQQRYMDGQRNNRQSESRPDDNAQVFNGRNASSSQPKFVTPKMSGGSTSRRLSQGETQPRTPPGNKDREPDFQNMWNQLQSGMAAKGSSAASQGKPLQQTANKGKSLSQAAASLPNPNTDQNQNNNASQMTTKIDVESLFTQASRASASKANPSLPISMSVGEKSAAISKNNQSQAPKTPGSSKVVSNDEFAAMFKSLEAVQVSDDETEQQVGTPEDSAIVVKKTQADNQPDGGGAKTYGRQVSIQELFDGAKKQQEQPETTTKSQPQPRQQQQQQQQHHQQQQQQQHQRKGGAPVSPREQGYQQHQQQPFLGQHPNQKRPNMLMGAQRVGNRNPVMDLMSFCQSIPMGLPVYEYIPKGGMCLCVVILMNGARFQGSACRSKEEAAESAASVALIQLKGSMQQMVSTQMMQGFIPGAMPQGRQFSSPNSAFSPVSTFTGNMQGPGGHMQGPGGRGGHYQAYGQRSYGGQGYQQQQYGNRGYQQSYPPASQAGHYNPAYQNQVPRGQSSHYPSAAAPQNPAYQNVGRREDASVPASKAGAPGTGEGKSQPTCVVTPFVPLQVVKKQTPQKGRKESISDETKPEEKASASVETVVRGDHSPRVQHDQGQSYAPVNNPASNNVELDSQGTRKSVTINSERGPSESVANISVENKKSAEKNRDKASGATGTDEDGGGGKQKKSRRRIAANFNFNQ